MELRRIDLVRPRATPVADAGMSTADEVRATAAAVTVRPGFVRQLSLMIGAWRASGSGRAIVQRMLIVVLVIGATVYGQIRLNQWNKPFFDALDRKSTRLNSSH